MSFVEDYSKFHQMEEQLDLFQKDICGEKFWSLIRFKIYSATFGRSSSDVTPSTRRIGFGRLKRFLFSLFSWRRNPLFTPKSQILFIFPGRRVLENDGMWWDIYSDPIIKHLEYGTAALEDHYKNKHFVPAATPRLRYMDLVEFLTFMKTQLRITRIDLDKDALDLLRSIRTELQERFDVDVDVRAITHRVLRDRRARVPLYRWMMKRIQPRVVVFAQGYGYEDAIEACSQLGIPTVELQHGAINPYHVGYSFDGKIGVKKNFPDYLLTWGDYWSSAAGFPIEESRVYSVGFPYIERKKDIEAQRKQQILFISQETIGVALSKFANELSNIQDFEYEILYKLHPHERADWKTRYPWLVSSNVKVIDQPQVLLYDLFSECKIQIGVYSTALFEGLAFGLRTFLVDIKGVGVMESLLKSGLVKKVSSIDELISDLKNVEPPKPIEFEFFFKTNALSNISEFFSRFFTET
jgi:hypothetical protein